MKRILSFVTAAAFSSTMLSGAFSGAGITFVHAADSKDVVDVFMDNYDEWSQLAMSKNDYAAVGFLDIDFDGVLELVCGSLGGSGYFTDLQFYKAEAEHVTTLSLCSIAESNGFPDILSDNAISLYQSADGNMAYYGDDYIRAGARSYGRYFCSFFYDSMRDNVTLRNYWGTGSELQNDQWSDWWYDCQTSKELTESEYESLTEKEMAQLTDLELHCKFTDIRKMSMDEIKIALIESYKSFSYNGFTSSEPVEDELIELAVPQPTPFYNYAVSQKIGSKSSPRYAGDGDSWYLMWEPIENADCYEVESEYYIYGSESATDYQKETYTKTTTDTFLNEAGSINCKKVVKIRAKKFLSNGDALYSEWSEPRTAYVSCEKFDTEIISDYDKEGWRDAYRDLLKIYTALGTDIFPDNEFTMMYGLKDLNQDGIPELLISFSDVESDDGYVVHTYDGKAEVVLDQYGVRTYVDRLKEFETLVFGLSKDARAYLLSDTSGIDTWGSSTPEEPSAITVNAKAYEGRYCGKMEYLSTSSNAMVSGLWRVELEAVSETELSVTIELLNPDTKEIHSRVVYQGNALETIIFEAEDKYGGWNTNAYTLKLSGDSLHLNAKCQIFNDELHGWQIPDADITLHRETETPVNRSISGWTDSQIADAINAYLTCFGDKSADFFGGYLCVTASEFQEDEAGRYVTAHLKDAGTGATQIEYRIRWNNEDDIATFGANGTDSYYLFHLTDFADSEKVLSPEERELIDNHIEQMRKNSYGFVSSDSSDELRNLKSYMENDDATISFKVLKAISDSTDGKYQFDKDRFQQELAVQSMYTEILCNPDVFTSMGDAFFDAANKKTNDLLDAISVCQTFEEIAEMSDISDIAQDTYDIKGELMKILSMSDKTSPEFIAAKNKWIIKANDYTKATNTFDGLFSELELLGFGVEIADLAINNLKDLYVYCQLSAGYSAMDDTSKEALACFCKSYQLYEYMQSEVDFEYARQQALYSSFTNYYDRITDSENSRFTTFILEMMNEDIEIISTRVGAIAAEKIILEGIVAYACPELYAVLKGAKIAIDIGLIIWDRNAQMGERMLARDMCLNYMIFQDVIYYAMRDETSNGGFAYRLVNDYDTHALYLYECGFIWYKAIYCNTLKYGRQYYEYRSLITQDFMGQPNENWAFAEFAKILAFKIEEVKAMTCHGEQHEGESFESNCASYIVACPVDVHILYNGKEIALLTEKGVEKCEDESVLADVLTDCNHPFAYKFFVVPLGYNVEIHAFADGTMDFQKIVFENSQKSSITYKNNITIQENATVTEQVINNKTYALYIDTDGDGEIDDTLDLQKLFVLGDINDDGSVNAVDASDILLAAAMLGAGEDSGLTEDMEKAADVNSDGEINALDAATVLVYSAAVGAGQEDAKLEDFIE